MLSAYSSRQLQYENYSLGRILFQTLKQHSDGKSLIAKTFDGRRVKRKAESPVQVIKNKNKCFQLCLDWTNTLVLTTHCLCVPKSRGLKRKFVHPCKSFFFQRCILNRQTSNKERLAKTPQIFNGWGLNAPLYFQIYRSSRSQMFFRMDFLKIFSVNIAEFLRIAIFIEHFWWLLECRIITMKQVASCTSCLSSISKFLECWKKNIHCEE